MITWVEHAARAGVEYLSFLITLSLMSEINFNLDPAPRDDINVSTVLETITAQMGPKWDCAKLNNVPWYSDELIVKTSRSEDHWTQECEIYERLQTLQEVRIPI